MERRSLVKMRTGIERDIDKNIDGGLREKETLERDRNKREKNMREKFSQIRLDV